MTRHNSIKRARQAGVAMLRQGHANLSEVASLAGVTRQGVRRWAQVAYIDWQAARTERLARLWKKKLAQQVDGEKRR
jgi:hypothetical protein